VNRKSAQKAEQIYDAPQPFTELTAKTEDGVIRLKRVTPSSF